MYVFGDGKRWMTHEKVLIPHEKRLIPHEKSINVAIINSNSQKASKIIFLDIMMGGGCFEGAI